MKLNKLPLYFYFILHELGRVNVMLMILILVGIGSIKWLAFDMARLDRHQKETLQTLSNTLNQFEKNKSIQQKSNGDVFISEFERVLGEHQYLEQDIKTIFDIAVDSSIVLKTGEYKLSDNLDGHFMTYQLQFPVKGSYQQNKHFVEQVLLKIPYISLDEINFKREKIDNPTIDSRISFTLFLKNQTDSKNTNQSKVFE